MATLDEIHEVQFRMFQWFDELCEKLNIRYSMVAGTLLGAVRHQGFIPWDDDIDVYMSAEDAAILEKHFQSDTYFLQTPRTDRESSYIMFRIRKNGTTMVQKPVEDHVDIHKGVWMDVFLYTDAAKSRIGKKLQLRVMKALQSFRCRFYHANCHPERKLYAFLARLPNGFNLFVDRVLFRVVRMLGNRRSGEIFALDVREPYFFKRSYMEDMAKYPFEGGEFWGIAAYDEYLRGFYGDDYMTPKKWGHIEDYSRVVL